MKQKQDWMGWILVLCLLVAPCANAATVMTQQTPEEAEVLGPWINYGGTGMDVIYGALAMPDGGMLLLGDTTSNDGDLMDVRVNTSDNYGDAWAVRTRADGEVVWQWLLGTDDQAYEVFEEAALMPDGNLAIRYMYANGKGITYRVFIVDDSGAQVGEIALPEENSGVALLEDGYVTIGLEPTGGDFDQNLTTLARYDWEGNLRWEREYPDLLHWYVQKFYADGEDLLVTGMWRETFEYSGSVTRLDAQGAVQWHTVLEQTGFGVICALAPLADGGMVVAGMQTDTTQYQNGIQYGLVVRLDAEGEALWSRGLAVDGEDVQFTGALTVPEGILLNGFRFLYAPDGSNLRNEGWFVLMDLDGNVLADYSDGYQSSVLCRYGEDGPAYVAATIDKITAFGFAPVLIP